jgi:hypothetical protein
MSSLLKLYAIDENRKSAIVTRAFQHPSHGIPGMIGRSGRLILGDPDIPFKELPAYPSLATVEQLILNEKRGNCVPVYVQLPADLITPCMAYLRIAKDSRYSFLLESVIGGKSVSRYSFIGAGQSSSISADHQDMTKIGQILSRSSSQGLMKSFLATPWPPFKKSSRFTNT